MIAFEDIKELKRGLLNMNIKKFGLLAVILLLGGCIATTFPYMRDQTAQRIAAPAWMIKRDIAASPYILRAYERIHNRGGFANIYIEGDGAVFTSPLEWKNNPTPKNPVALHLASKDRAGNVIYIARPCQYNGMASGQPCDESAWKENRFSDEVVNSFSIALDDIARRYDINGFHLIGYSGGGAIATLLASKRKDILSIRTIAGILDHKAQSDIIGLQELSGSLNPVDVAALLVKTPQYHFVGGQDKFVPPAVLHSYIQAMPPTNCVQTMLVQEAGYEKGWVDKWPEFLKLPVTCYHGGVAMGGFEDIAEEDTSATVPKDPAATLLKPKPIKP